MQTNMINVKPKSINVDESIIKRAEPDPPRSLRDHFYHQRTSSLSGFGLPPILKDMTF